MGWWLWWAKKMTPQRKVCQKAPKVNTNYCVVTFKITCTLILWFYCLCNVIVFCDVIKGILFTLMFQLSCLPYFFRQCFFFSRTLSQWENITKYWWSGLLILHACWCKTICQITRITMGNTCVFQISTCRNSQTSCPCTLFFHFDHIKFLRVLDFSSPRLLVIVFLTHSCMHSFFLHSWFNLTETKDEAETKSPSEESEGAEKEWAEFPFVSFICIFRTLNTPIWNYTICHFLFLSLALLWCIDSICLQLSLSLWRSSYMNPCKLE